MRRAILRGGCISAVAALLVLSSAAHATNVTEFPDNGSEQMGRGGAWVARASDPLAAFFNPAGLAGQETRITVQANISFAHTCFTRTLGANDSTQDALVDPANGNYKYPRVCNDIEPFANPQLGMTWRVSDRVGIGFLPLLAPSSVGKTTWPEFVDGKTPNQPSPNRYLLLKTDGIIISPTIGAGFEVADGLRLGASFQWGIAGKLHFENASTALNAENLNPRDSDVKAELDAKQLFIPGFTLGALWSASEYVDIAGWYKWSAPIDTTGDVKTHANYFTTSVANGNTSGVKNGDSSQANCGVTGGSTACGSGDNAHVRVPIPMEAKLGVRFHKPRGESHRKSHVRDPMSQDVWDLEVDLTWANNSSFDAIQLRFPSDPKSGLGALPVNGIPGGTLPPNADVTHNYKDVIGIRVGGDFNVVQDKLALRAGAFFETRGQDPQFQNIDFSGAERFGMALGGTYRVRLGEAAKGKKNALEFSLGYGHVFYGIQNNNQPENAGLRGLSGAPCNPGSATAGVCPNGNPAYRTNWAVNLGTITNSTNVFNVGASYRF